jgi:hypothetical protein
MVSKMLLQRTRNKGKERIEYDLTSRLQEDEALHAPSPGFFCSPPPPANVVGSCSSPTRGGLDRSGVLSLAALRACRWTELGDGDRRLLPVVGDSDRRPDCSPGSRLLSALALRLPAPISARFAGSACRRPQTGRSGSARPRSRRRAALRTARTCRCGS